MSIISAGDLPFVPSHFSKSKMRTRCSTAGCWTLKAIVKSFHSVATSETGVLSCCLILGADGQLYGTTPLGGIHGYGTAFELTQ